MENNLQVLNSTDVLQARTLDMVLTEKKDYFIEKIERLLKNANYSVDRYATIKNLDLWCENKSRLFNLLKTSEYWNEEELCIEMPFKYIRDVNIDLIEDVFYFLQRSVSQDIQSNTIMVLRSLLQKMNKTTRCVDLENVYKSDRQLALDEEAIFTSAGNFIDDFIERYHIKSGMKMSKVINKVLTESGCNIDLNLGGINHHKEITGVNKKRDDGTYEIVWTYTYNQWYAIISDSLNPKEEEKSMYISINPMDYLTQSHGYNWQSCHSLRNRGCYHAATMTMLTDTSTLIVYTLPKKQESEYWSYDKLVRCSMFIGENFNCILQNKLYPSKNMENTKQVREYIEKLCADYLGVENTWLIPSLKDVNIDTIDYLGYCDWECSGNYYACAKLKNSTKQYNIKIGHYAYCVNDSDETIEENSFLSYGDVHCCDCCNEYFDESEMTYVERYDRWVCDDCLDEYYVWCVDTDRYVHRDDAFYAEDDNDWFEDYDNVYCCEYTGNYYREATYVEDYGYVNDEDLRYSGKFFRCDKCGNWFKLSWEHNEYYGLNYCNSCYEELDDEE